MLKKSMVVIGALLVISNVFAANSYPKVEFIKDGQVIESRAMTHEEVEAYDKIQRLEYRLEDIENPLEALEEQVEQQADLIEQQVDQAMGTVASHGEMAISVENKVKQLRKKVEQMRPVLAQMRATASEISASADEFKQLILADYSEQDIDQVRIINDEEEENANFSVE